MNFVPATGTVITELPGDLRLFVDLADRVIGMNILRGAYELEEVEFIRSCIGPGDHVLDIGANIGYFTILMANWVGEEGSVVAFDATLRTCSCSPDRLPRTVSWIASA